MLKNKSLLCLLLFVVLVLLDQGVKIYIVNSDFVYSVNRLYILGLFSLNKYLYLGLVLCISVFLVRRIFLIKDTLIKNIYIILLSGIISQSIDRVGQGYVIDYINIFNLTTINLADLYIVISVAILIIFSYSYKRLNF